MKTKKARAGNLPAFFIDNQNQAKRSGSSKFWFVFSHLKANLEL
jgi:hypothetical protein